MYYIFIATVFLIALTESHSSQSLLKQWLADYSVAEQVPVAYIVTYTQAKESPLVEESVKIEEISGDVDSQFGSRSRVVRHVASPNRDGRLDNSMANNNSQPTPNGMNLKAKLRYHHEQRHPNGSVTGSYGQMEPNGKLKIVHYIKDQNGFREIPNPEMTNQYPSSGGAGTGINVQLASQQGAKNEVTSPKEHSINLTNRRGIFYPIEGQPQSPIIQSAAGSVQTFGGDRSPLHEKYYRPSPEEVQKAYDYHRQRSQIDPNSIRPQDATPLPDLPPQRTQPELQGVYGEYQSPITNFRYREQNPNNGYYVYASPQVDDARYYNMPQYAAPGPLYNQQPQLYNLPPGAVQPYYLSGGNVYLQNPYPQTLPPQSPLYVQKPNDQSAFVPASTYSGPVSPNTATFNQPYPTNVPIYADQPVPQNIPTYVQRPPENIPIYQDPGRPIYSQGVGGTPVQAIPAGLPLSVLGYAGINPNTLVSQ